MAEPMEKAGPLSWTVSQRRRLRRGRGHLASQGAGARTRSTRAGLPARTAIRGQGARAAQRARRSVWSGLGNSRVAPRPGCEPLHPLPFKSPPGIGNRGVAGDVRMRPIARPPIPPAYPRPGRKDSRARQGWQGHPLGPRDPEPLGAPPGTGKKGRWDVTAPARKGAHAPPHAPATRGSLPAPSPLSLFPSALTWG